MSLFSKLITKVKARFGFPEAVLFEKMSARKNATFFVYGMGQIGQELLSIVEQTGKPLNIEGVFDSKAEYNPFDFRGFKVQGPAEMQLSHQVIVIASVKFSAEIREMLQGKWPDKDIDFVVI